MNVFNFIAAGNPILINSDVDLDGNTTLKRFVKMGDTVLLMPENPSYESIQVKEGQMRILGVAVGILKRV